MLDQYKTKEDVLKLSIVDPELEQILKDHPAPKMDFGFPIEQLRGIVSAMEKSTFDTCPTFNTEESTLTIPIRNNRTNELYITKPANTTPTSKNPVVVLIFGGAFIMGTNIQSIIWARAIAHLYNATVIQPSYRLAPENKFPAAPNDIWDSIKWIAANESSLSADLRKGFVLGGGSAGGNLSIITAHRSVKEKLNPPITGVLASIPVCMSTETVPSKYKELYQSREQNVDAPGNPGADSKKTGGYEALYGQDFFSEDFSPFNMDVPFSEIPRTYVQVAGLDELRDDGIIYAKVLKDSGVEVEFDVYPGMPHGHFNMWPGLKASIKSQEDTIWYFGWLLRQEVPREKVEEIVAQVTRK